MQNPFDLTGKVAVVTGGNGGIGLGMAEALAGAGCAVHIWGRNQAKNERALERLRAKGGRAEAVLCDVSDAKSVEAAMAKALAAFGRVDGCFANAGMGGGGRRSFIARPLAEWRELLATNLDGAFLTLQAAARHMVERAGKGDAFGRLVVTDRLPPRPVPTQWRTASWQVKKAPSRFTRITRRHSSAVISRKLGARPPTPALA